MRSWKTIFAVGAACLGCCAVPLLSGTLGVAAGASALAAFGASLARCARELLPVAGLVAAGAGLFWWRRQAQRRIGPRSACEEGCGADCR